MPDATGIDRVGQDVVDVPITEGCAAFHPARDQRSDGGLQTKGINRFFNLDSAAYRDGALDGKTKELLGLVASSVLRCNDCIDYHLEQCVEAGFSLTNMA